MVDATGMCGTCRVEVANKTRFACVDGPDFDGHDVNFEMLAARQKMYKDEESKAIKDFEKKCNCRLEDHIL
jgi:ferredoxin--NADP+ reductase